MQQLYLHPTWEKAISYADRTLIEKVFEETYTQTDDVIMNPIVRTAFNYKQELLVTVLIHNFTHHAIRIKNRSVYLYCGEYFEEKVFNIPELTIAPFTSMPWTFIFEPKDDYSKLDVSQVILEIV